MATTTTREPSASGIGASESGFGFGEAATAWMPLAKDFFGIQIKTAQMFMDQSVKLSQTFADFYQNQAAESLKLTQACVSTGKGVAEEIRRSATTIVEKVAVRN